MRYASRKVVLLVTALFSFTPVRAAMAGTMAPDQAALRVLISLAVAWVLVGLLSTVSHTFMEQRSDDPSSAKASNKSTNKPEEDS